MPWVALAAAFCALELTELFSQPRSANPTLSSLTNTLLDSHPSKFVGYAGWLALGGCWSVTYVAVMSSHTLAIAGYIALLVVLTVLVVGSHRSGGTIATAGRV